MANRDSVRSNDNTDSVNQDNGSTKVNKAETQQQGSSMKPDEINLTVEDDDPEPDGGYMSKIIV